MKTSEIRQRWLDFFEKRGHTVVPSSSLISEDPNLLFTIAGMVPFIPYLSGLVPAPYPRATSVQKVIRTVDIEEVGKTPRHGTFFQMNGNFSFGDYFKREAIEYAWQFLTGPESEGCLGFRAEDLWVTIYEEDDEAHDLWLELSTLPEERIQRLGRDSNFWHTGQDGPGGPSSEIFFDRGPAYGIDGGPATDDDRYVEIWNLVFMQYQLVDVQSSTEFTIKGDLPKKNIDTGMGLERVAFIKQGVENMYEIDEVRPVLDAAADLAQIEYGADAEDDIKLRIIADHVRSALMLISDGVTPSNETRGYILRRVLRRVILSLRLLGVEGHAFPVLFEASRDAMKESYPEVASDFGRISQIAYAEETSFLKTLASGLQTLEGAISTAQTQKSSLIDGANAFKLHDTFGFPIDLTIEIVEEAGLKVDRTAFERLMQEQRQRAREDAKNKRRAKTDNSVYSDFRSLGETEFFGYDELIAEAKILGIIKDGTAVKSAGPGDIVEVILDGTAMYAEAGGQDSDQGLITGDGFELEVLDVQRPIPGLVSHYVKINFGEIGLDMAVNTRVDAESRRGSNQAHTATHVVHAALREILGHSAHQAGSYNKPGYMRLDYSWAQSISPTTKSEIEDLSNQALRENYVVTTRQMPIDEAKALGAMALFGEKYGDTVRMVELNGAWSRELCGGTHVDTSSEIGVISLVSESSIGSSARRMEALVGYEAFQDFALERTIVQGLSTEFKVPKTEIPARIRELTEQLKHAEHRITELQNQSLLRQLPEFLKKVRQVGNTQVLAEELKDIHSADQLRVLAAALKNELGATQAVIVLAAVINDKPALVIAATAAAVSAAIKAGDLVRIGSQILGGGGGGKPDMAQGGGTDPAKIQEALQTIIGAISL